MKGYDNLFLALQPDTEMANFVERRIVPEVRRASGFSERSRGVDLLHLSLLSLGGYDTVPWARVDHVRDALSNLACSCFDVTLDTVMQFAKGAIVLTGENAHAVRDFSDELRNALKSGGVRRLGPVCRKPHMTLLYSEAPFHELKVQPVKLRFREFVLIHSLVGQSRHVVLEQWPLLVNQAGAA